MAQSGLGTIGAYSIAPVSVIFVLFMYLIECLVAFLQAYIFTLLTSLFIGLAIKNKSNELLKFVKKNLNKEKILVAVGGVFDVDSYNEKIELGADLVQLYTGLIYEGPNIVKRILNNGK
mgnify:CR=1 FL=1